MSELKTMTVHAALSYIKTADKRISKLLMGSKFVSVAKSKADKVDGLIADDAKKEMIANYNAVCDVIKNVEAIKKAISKSNAETMITVCGQKMSVAEAIYMMNYGIETKKMLLSTLTSQYNSAKISVDRANGDELDRRADQFIASIYGNKEKASGAEALAEREKFKATNSVELIDPIGIGKQIVELSNWIDEFESDVDGAIQVSNATTMITIEV